MDVVDEHIEREGNKKPFPIDLAKEMTRKIYPDFAEGNKNPIHLADHLNNLFHKLSTSLITEEAKGTDNKELKLRAEHLSSILIEGIDLKKVELVRDNLRNNNQLIEMIAGGRVPEPRDMKGKEFDLGTFTQGMKDYNELVDTSKLSNVEQQMLRKITTLCEQYSIEKK
jgi:hypothetical protein